MNTAHLFHDSPMTEEAEKRRRARLEGEAVRCQQLRTEMYADAWPAESACSSSLWMGVAGLLALLVVGFGVLYYWGSRRSEATDEVRNQWCLDHGFVQPAAVEKPVMGTPVEQQWVSGVDRRPSSVPAKTPSFRDPYH